MSSGDPFRGRPRCRFSGRRHARLNALGQGLVEYGLILALTCALTVVWLGVFGGAIAEALTVIGEAIDQAAGG